MRFAFGALMRGPLVGLSEQELLDITAALPPGKEAKRASSPSGPIPHLVQHPLGKSILQDLQTLRKTGTHFDAEFDSGDAIERLNARVIMAARHRNRNARALANLDALIERARRYGVAGLRAFVRDLQADWERKRGRPKAASMRPRMRSRSSPSIAPKASNGPS